MHFEHGFQYHLRRGDVSDAPPGHGIGFGKPIQQHRAFTHARHCRDTDMFGIIDQATVHLVYGDDQVVLLSKSGDAF